MHSGGLLKPPAVATRVFAHSNRPHRPRRQDIRGRQRLRGRKRRFCDSGSRTARTVSNGLHQLRLRRMEPARQVEPQARRQVQDNSLRHGASLPHSRGSMDVREQKRFRHPPQAVCRVASETLRHFRRERRHRGRDSRRLPRPWDFGTGRRCRCRSRRRPGGMRQPSSDAVKRASGFPWRRTSRRKTARQSSASASPTR